MLAAKRLLRFLLLLSAWTRGIVAQVREAANSTRRQLNATEAANSTRRYLSATGEQPNSSNSTETERKLAGHQAKKPELVGHPRTPEWQPALDLAFLRPPVASRDVYRPACELPAGSGKFTGVCTEEITEAPKLMSFCSDLIRYRACVPAHQVMWPNWNATAKDLLLKDLFKDMVELRIAREMNVTPDMYVPIHFMSNPRCINALRNALCWYNFPKCSDVNRSLPLCTSTCNEYYSNCKYPAGGDGSFPGCSEGTVGDEGLFQAGIEPGPDQTLAEDRPVKDEGTCRRVPSDAEIGITVVPAVPAWFTTWWGIALLSIAGLVTIAFFAFMLIPPVLMEYLVKTGRRLITAPYRLWMALPLLRGKKVLSILALVFLVLMVAGIYQTLQGGFKRWDEWKDTSLNSPFQFQPPQYIWGTQAVTPLSNQQLRQLKLSCTCTGGAYRGVPTILSLVAVTAPLLLLLLGTNAL